MHRWMYDVLEMTKCFNDSLCNCTPLMMNHWGSKHVGVNVYQNNILISTKCMHFVGLYCNNYCNVSTNVRYSCCCTVHIVGLYNSTPTDGDRGNTMVKVLCYKSVGRWFDPSWCQWIFHWHKILPIALWLWGHSASNRTEYREYFLGVKAAGA